MHFHDVANDVFAGEVDEDQSERFTRTQHLAQDTKEVFRTLCLETRVCHVNNFDVMFFRDGSSLQPELAACSFNYSAAGMIAGLGARQQQKLKPRENYRVRDSLVDTVVAIL